METPKDNILFMKLEHNVHIEIDQKKLADRKPDAVHVQMLDSRARTLGPVAQLVHGLTVIAQDKWEVDEVKRKKNYRRLGSLIRFLDNARYCNLLESLHDDTK